MTRVLVTGSNGGLGQEVVRMIGTKGEYGLLALDRSALDITSRMNVRGVVRRFYPDVIINAAAYTAVDDAEINRDVAFAVNAAGPQYLAEAANEVGAKLCHISTDYVFGGELAVRPFREDDPISPLGVYGESKAAGEKAVLEGCCQSFVVRTAWLYSAFGPNFVRTMIRAGSKAGDDGLRVVDDQVGSPTWTRDLARFVLNLIQSEAYGIYHGCNSGACSWYEFAKEIFTNAGMDVRVQPVTTEQFPRPAKRPRYSVLEGNRLMDSGFEPFRPWQDALAAFFDVHKNETASWR